MADKLTKAEKTHEFKMREAIRLIRSDPNLRYFLRQFIALTGVEDSVAFEETNRAMIAFGRHSAGVELRTALMSYDLTLYAELMLEDAREQLIDNNQKENEDEDDLDTE